MGRHRATTAVRLPQVGALALLVFLAGSWWATARADLAMDISIDTSSLSGQTGYLTLQFESATDSPLAYAYVTNFDVGVNGPPVYLAGYSSGAYDISSFPSVTFTNSDNTNPSGIVTESLIFGDKITFNLNLTGGSGDIGGNGSAFYMNLYDIHLMPIFTYDHVPDSNTVVTANITPAGQENAAHITIDPYQIVTGAPDVTATPEPSSIALVVAGGLSLLIVGASRFAKARKAADPGR